MMGKRKIIFLLLLTCSTYVTNSEEPPSAEDRISSQKPPDKLVLEKSTPYQKEEPSFMSRIASWLFPFGSSSEANDSTAAETRRGGPQYLPPEPGCNPCNRAPWIPVASNIGHDTVINFDPPSSHSYPQPPRQQYGPPIFRPIPQKNNYGLPPRPSYGPPDLKPPPLRQQYRAPPVTHLRPILPDYGMRPPPLKGGNYHSLPPTASSQYGQPDQYLPPPPPPPSDSYGAPVTGPNSNYQIRPEFLPPVEQLPLSSDDNFHGPIPIPNLSPGPVLPLHNAQNFHDNVPQPDANLQITSPDETSVQVVPSIKIADFLSSIEHPINVIHSPLVEVTVKNNNPEVEPELNQPSTSTNIQNSHIDDVRPGGFYNDNTRLSENPIVVEDTHTAASAINATVHNHSPQEGSFRSESHSQINGNFIKELLLHQEIGQPQIDQKLNWNKENRTFTPPPMDYSKWEPSWGGSVSTSMVPPPLGPTTWLHPIEQKPTSSTTKRPKQIQIIIPYINNKQPLPFDQNQGRKVPQNKLKGYTTLLPVYSPPSSTEESLWAKFAEDFHLAESKRVTATAFTPAPSTTQVYNIRDLLKGTKAYQSSDKLPFDVISLQNNIDDWTQQEYSKSLRYPQKSTTSAKFIPSKKIPQEYFTTQPYSETTTVGNFDYEPASSNKKETKPDDDIESNLIFQVSTTEEIATTTTTQKPTTTRPSPIPFSPKGTKSLWDITSVTISPITKEKVYIVTPQPYNSRTTPKTAWSLPPQVYNLKNSTLAKFIVRVDPENRMSREKLLQQQQSPLTVVFSEWPHLINNLQTTTTKAPTSRHPLLGLMDLSAYTPPPNSTVETFSGHSKVVTVVTPSSVTKH